MLSQVHHMSKALSEMACFHRGLLKNKEPVLHPPLHMWSHMKSSGLHPFSLQTTEFCLKKTPKTHLKIDFPGWKITEANLGNFIKRIRGEKERERGGEEERERQRQKESSFRHLKKKIPDLIYLGSVNTK